MCIRDRGNTLAPNQTDQRPTVQFVLNEPTKKINEADLFTFVITDPDAPSRHDHKWSEYCHYVETDIKLDGFTRDADFLASEVDQGKQLMSYVGPAPPKGTGLHRYCLLFFKQPNGVASDKFTKIKDRPNWGFGTPATGVHKWATENKLELIAANFFFAENK